MSWSTPGPAGQPNPMNPPPLPHDRQGGQSGALDVRWFVIGLFLMAALIAGLTYWAATSSPSEEIEFDVLEREVRLGAVEDLAISGNEVSGDFLRIRQSYDGDFRGLNEPVPDGYSESDARAIKSFTATIPDGESKEFIELVEVSDVSYTIE